MSTTPCLWDQIICYVCLYRNEISIGKFRLFKSCFSIFRLPKNINDINSKKTFFFHHFTVEIYLSPIETHCSNIDYFPSIDNAGDTEESTRLHLARGVIALFILSFLAVVCAFFTGLSGMNLMAFLLVLLKYALLPKLRWLIWVCEILTIITQYFLFRRMLEKISGCNYGNSNTDAYSMLISKWCYGIVAYSRILWERKGCWWGILPTMAKCKFHKTFVFFVLHWLKANRFMSYPLHFLFYNHHPFSFNSIKLNYALSY